MNKYEGMYQTTANLNTAGSTSEISGVSPRGVFFRLAPEALPPLRASTT